MGIEEKITDAKENLGDMEVRDALIAKAEFFNRIGDKDAAIQAYQDAFEKTVGVGGKMDNILTVIRIAFFFDDHTLAKKEIDRAKAELAKGGDWERRNKLKVYEGIHLMISRQWKDAATLFLNVMPTFTALELVEFMESYFYSKYKPMVEHFVPIIDIIRADRYLSRHCRHFMRIMRLNAYRQFLASYRSVKLEAMANEFGVSSSFIDAKLASFISSGKLTCKIDKVGEIIESNESDNRSQVYVEIVKQGDALVNRMQKLSGALDM